MQYKTTNNKGVAEAWLSSQAAKSHNGNYHTDGQNLYSYAMLIGKTWHDGSKLLLNVRGYSMTTTRHMSLAYRADYTIPRVEIAINHGQERWFVFPDDSLIPDMLYTTVNEIPDTFTLVNVDYDVEAVADYLGYSKRSKYSPRHDYLAYFVLVSDGDYTRIYGMTQPYAALTDRVTLLK